MRFNGMELAEETVKAHKEISELNPLEAYDEDQLDDVKRDVVTFCNIIEASGDFVVNPKED